MQSIRTVCRRTAVVTTVMWGVGGCVCMCVCLWEGRLGRMLATCWICSPLSQVQIFGLASQQPTSCLMPVEFLLLFCAIWIICVELFEWGACKIAI